MVWPIFVGAVAIDLIIKHTKKRQEDPIPTGKNRIWVGLGWQGRMEFYSDIRLESLYEILKDVPRQYHNKICHDLQLMHPLLHFRINNVRINLLYKNHPNPEVKNYFQEELEKEVSRLKNILVSKGYRFEEPTPVKYKEISKKQQRTILPPDYNPVNELAIVPMKKKEKGFIEKYIKPLVRPLFGITAIAFICGLSIPFSFNLNLIGTGGALSLEVWKFGENSKTVPQICDVPDFKKKKPNSADDTKEQEESEDKINSKNNKKEKSTPKEITDVPSGIEEIFEKPKPVLVDNSKTKMKFSSSISTSLTGDGVLRSKISNDNSSYGVFLKPDMPDGRNSLGIFLGKKLPKIKVEPVKIYDLSKTNRSSIKTFDVCRTEFYREEQIGIVEGRLFTENRYGVETDINCINNGLHNLHKMVLAGGVGRSAIVLGTELMSIGPEIISIISPVVAASVSISK